MNQPLTDAQETWIQALESGEYNQGTGALHKQDSFCCLGVACDLYKKELSVEHREGFTTVMYDGSLVSAPHHVVKQLKLHSKWGTSKNKVEGTLSTLNDDGSSFAEIAAMLRADPEDYFYVD